MATRANRWHRATLRHRQRFTALQPPKHHSRFDSGSFGKRRSFDLAMQPNNRLYLRFGRLTHSIGRKGAMSTMASRNVGFIRVASSSFVAHDSEANDQAPIVRQSNKQTYLLGFRVRHARKVRPINGRSPGGVPVQGDSLRVPFPRKRLFPFYRFRTRKQLKSLTPLKHPAARTLAS